MFKFKLLFLAISCLCIFSEAQTLQIPQRDSEFPSGTEIIKSLTDLSLENREVTILNEVLRGNIPDFYRTLFPVNDSALIGGEYKHITYYVIPDYLALGSDSDYFLCPMTPILAQVIADSLSCTLPTRKMVNQIWMAAPVKMEPQTIPPGPKMVTVPEFAKHDSMIKSQRQILLQKHPLGDLVSGNKKDVIISNSIYNNSSRGKVVIYGWHYPTGEPIQPVYAGHSERYADYSHGIRLVYNKVDLNGETLCVADVLRSTKLHILLSDEGVILVPSYPDTSKDTIGAGHPIQKK